MRHKFGKAPLGVNTTHPTSPQCSHKDACEHVCLQVTRVHRQAHNLETRARQQPSSFVTSPLDFCPKLHIRTLLQPPIRIHPCAVTNPSTPPIPSRAPREDPVVHGHSERSADSATANSIFSHSMPTCMRTHAQRSVCKYAPRSRTPRRSPPPLHSTIGDQRPWWTILLTLSSSLLSPMPQSPLGRGTHTHTHAKSLASWEGAARTQQRLSAPMPLFMLTP